MMVIVLFAVQGRRRTMTVDGGTLLVARTREIRRLRRRVLFRVRGRQMCHAVRRPRVRHRMETVDHHAPLPLQHARRVVVLLRLDGYFRVRGGVVIVPVTLTGRRRDIRLVVVPGRR